MKKDKFSPQFVKDAHGTTTHVYLPLKAYEAMIQTCNEWKKIQKEKGVRWVQISREKKKS
jgi:hypothetical protein